MNKFKSFTTEDDVFGYPKQSLAMEAVGKSDASLPLPMSEPLAYTLTLLEGNALRTRALNWFLYDGLKKAIIGREKLCDIVNKALQGQLNAGTARGPARHTTISPSQKVVGEVSDANAAIGRDEPNVNDPNYMVHACDLFSPIAYQRDPRLAELDIDGLSISEYYDKHFEPRAMVIDYNPGEPIIVNLTVLRDILIHKGLEPFTYGGFHGYLQYVEKGDKLSPHEKNSYDPNQQWGHDLSLDRSSYPDAESVVSYKDAKIPTLHLKGGSINKSGFRNSETINQMGKTFADVAERIQNSNNTEGLSQELVNHVSNILSLEKQIHKIEVGINDEGRGRGQAADQLGFHRSQNTQSNFCKIPPEFSEENLKLAFSLFRKGLEQPFKAKKSEIQIGDKILPRFTDLAKFGPEWNGEGPEPDGWHRLTPDNKVIIKLSKNDQNAVYKYMITDPMQEFGGIYVRPDWSQIPEIQSRVHPDAGRFAFSTILNAGKDSDPAIMDDFKRVLYNFKDLDSSSYIKQLPLKEKEVTDPDNPGYDKVLGPLWDAGYRWELRNDYEVKHRKPQWTKFGNGILSLGSSKYKVINKNDMVNGQPVEKFFLLVPTKGDGKPVKVNDHGLPGRSILAGGMFATGGKGGHIKTQPAGPKTYQQLLAKLMSGDMGEPAVSSPIDLECVKEAITSARRYFGKYKGFDVEFDPRELLSWALEGLQACSGKTAWQVGFLSEAEFEHELRWSIEKRIELATEKGWGVSAIMSMIGLDLEDQESPIEAVMKMVMESPIIDLSIFPEAEQQAFKENSLKARVRMIQGYIVNMMTKSHDSKSKEKQAGQLAGKDGGTGGDVLDAGQKPTYRGEWEAGKDKLKVIDPTNDINAIEDEPSQNPIATFKQGRKPKTLKPIYVGDDATSSFDDQEKKPIQTVANPKIATPRVRQIKKIKDDAFDNLDLDPELLAKQGVTLSAPASKPTQQAPMAAKNIKTQQPVPVEDDAFGNLDLDPELLAKYGITLSASTQQPVPVSKPVSKPTQQVPMAAKSIKTQQPAPVEDDAFGNLDLDPELLAKYGITLSASTQPAPVEDDAFGNLDLDPELLAKQGVTLSASTQPAPASKPTQPVPMAA